MSPKQITYLLRSQIIPWAASATANRIVVARSEMRANDMPDEVTLSRRKIMGKRQIVKNQRKHGNLRLHIANWPQDNLHELPVAKVSCVVNGSADILVSKYSLHCSRGTFILIPPHLPHQRFGPFKQKNRPVDEWCTVIHAYAHSQGILFWLNRSSLSQHINDKKDNYLIPSISAARILELAIEETSAEKMYCQLIGGGLLSSFFAIVAREIEKGNYVHPGPKEALVPYRSTVNFADQVNEYLEANCDRRVKLEDVATHMFMSTSTFSRYMHRKLGKTFIELLTEIRIKRAKHMLRETDLTVTYIAGSLSFHSPTQFHKVFKRHVNCSPLEYRRSNKK